MSRKLKEATVIQPTRLFPDLEFENWKTFFPSSAEEAVKKGEKYYFDAIPCQNNHISPRKVRRNRCLACNAAYMKNKRARRPEITKVFNEKRKKKYHENRDQILKERKEKYANDPKLREKSREYSLRRIYGVELEDYNLMLEKQNGKCAICGSTSSNSTRTKHYCVDHDHKSKKVRSLLCHKCNFAIGYSNDSIDVLKNAIKYLEHHEK